MYNLTTEEVFSEVKSSRYGLEQKEAKNRLLENGKNKVNLDTNRTFGHKLGKQLSQIMMVVLTFALVANIVAAIAGKDKYQLINVGLIFVIIVLNVTVGILTTTRMEKTLTHIKKVLPSTTKVRRNNKIISVASEDLVVGDVVYLYAGDIVPADIRLIDTNNLKVTDTLITGQTMATEKVCDVIDGKYMPLGDRHNMVYMGSSIASGSGVGVVVATGRATELGKTQRLLSQEVSITTPTVKRINKFITALSAIVLILSTLSFIANILHRGNIVDSIMVAVSLAVCIVPESLFIAIYSTLIRSIKVLEKNNLLVKDLSCIENLGNIDVLCVDKTKVLTVNNKSVQNVWVSNMSEYELVDNPNFATLINCMVLSNDATIELNENNEVDVKGGSLEKALLNYALSNGFSKDNIEGIFPRVNVFPYDRYRKMMTSLNSVGQETHAFTKGDFERVFKKCNRILIDGRPMNITDYDRQNILKKYNAWKNDGGTVIAYATKTVSGNIYELQPDEVENDMVFVGISDILDPKKEDTTKILRELSNMDIKVVMMTSEDKESSYLIAKNMGIARSEKQVITGDALDMMTDVELFDKIENYTVFSRLLNGQKLRIIKALQKRNTVAVTGDNAEDLPAIQRADVGIGLAKSGCEVVKQTANLLTADDSLKSIAEGIKISKRVQFNATKMIEYMLSFGFAQLLLMAAFVMAFNKTFFSPTLILWLNFVNGLLPCFALGNQPTRVDINKKPKKESLFAQNSLKNIFIYGIIQCVVVCLMYIACTDIYAQPENVAVTMCFVTLTFMGIFHSYNVKDGDKSIFTYNPFNNKLLNIGFVVSIVATMLLVGLSFTGLHMALGLTTLTIAQWGICFGIGALMLLISELVKLFYRIEKYK